MDKKIVWLLSGIFGVVVVGILILNPFKQKSSLPLNTNQQEQVQITPSKTLKTYSDPSGFSFNYPDNLSLLNNELKDANSYAELQLTASGISGSLVLKIADSKLATLNEWVKINKDISGGGSVAKDGPKEVKLGNLKALEIKTNDKLLLGALDQGILFTIEIPQVEKGFWMDVYNKVLADFSFTPPTQEDTGSSSDDVSFDGEEVVQ